MYINNRIERNIITLVIEVLTHESWWKHDETAARGREIPQNYSRETGAAAAATRYCRSAKTRRDKSLLDNTWTMREVTYRERDTLPRDETTCWDDPRVTKKLHLFPSWGNLSQDIITSSCSRADEPCAQKLGRVTVYHRDRVFSRVLRVSHHWSVLASRDPPTKKMWNRHGDASTLFPKAGL